MTFLSKMMKSGPFVSHFYMIYFSETRLYYNINNGISFTSEFRLYWSARSPFKLKIFKWIWKSFSRYLKCYQLMIESTTVGSPFQTDGYSTYTLTEYMNSNECFIWPMLLIWTGFLCALVLDESKEYIMLQIYFQFIP